MAPPRWETFQHGADIGVRGIGATAAEAFVQAALALTSVISNPSDVHCVECVPLECNAPDLDILFLDWLNAIIYEMSTRKLLFCDYTVRIDGMRLVGNACGEPVEVARHHPAVEIKGATFTELKVAEHPDGNWIAQCVVDV